jgi:hypothetical protein
MKIWWFDDDEQLQVEMVDGASISRPANSDELTYVFGGLVRTDESHWAAARRLGLYIRRGGRDELNESVVKRLWREATDCVPEYHRDTDLSSREAGELAARHMARVYDRLLDRWAKRDR